MKKSITLLVSVICMVAITSTSMAQVASAIKVLAGTIKTSVRAKQAVGAAIGCKVGDSAGDNNSSTQERVSDLADGGAVGAVVGTTASVVGGSAATIMTATVGAPFIAGSGGFGAASLLNKHVFNGDTKADKAARAGTYVGATVGTATSVGTLLAVGAGPAGLATIGGVVGGGMAAGATIVLAAPIAAAAAVGGVFYWIFGD